MIDIHNRLSAYWDSSLHIRRSIFDELYNLASRISGYNVISGIIMPDVLRNPGLYDIWILTELNTLIRID